MAPNDQISVFKPYFCYNTAYGVIYKGVPTNILSLNYPKQYVANPKSAIFTRPELLNKIFAVLMSL